MCMGAYTVAALSATPVKGLRMLPRAEVMLTRDGVSDNRRFYLVDERGRMLNGKRLGALNGVIADYHEDERKLALHFADGSSVSGCVEHGEEIATTFFSRPARAVTLRGPFSRALSDHVGREVRVVECLDRVGVDRGRAGAVTLVSRASLEALARVAGNGDIDARRFRMLVEVDGLPEPHEEDSWVGEKLALGRAVVRVRGHVGRCLITERDPETGESDLPTLDLLRSYRGGLDTTEPLAFGVYGEVLEPGRVAVGDPVTPR